jgi:hypothetical protein
MFILFFCFVFIIQLENDNDVVGTHNQEQMNFVHSCQKFNATICKQKHVAHRTETKSESFSFLYFLIIRLPDETRIPISWSVVNFRAHIVCCAKVVSVSYLDPRSISTCHRSKFFDENKRNVVHYSS